MSTKHIKLFALSTCIHCKKAKEYLEECDLPYDCTYVDLLQGDERKQTIEEVKKHNPALSFPTIVINGGEKTVVGFDKEKLTKALS